MQVLYRFFCMQYFRSPRIRDNTVANIEKLKKEQLDVKLSAGVYFLKVLATEGPNTWPIVIE